MRHETRDAVVDCVRYWSEQAETPAKQILAWMGVPEETYYQWRKRYGKVNERNGWIPRDHWLEDWEKRAIIDHCIDHPREGYRRLTYMMLDADVVAVSPSSVYRVLKGAGLLGRFRGKPSSKGKGVRQPSRPHRHWHVDIAYVNICGTFYFMTSILDGYSRYIVHWEIREKMEEIDVEAIVQRAREKFPGERPRDHYRQRAAVCLQGFRAVRADLRDDARADQPPLSAKQREVGALSPYDQIGVHPAADTVVLGGCSADRHGSPSAIAGRRNAQCLKRTPCRPAAPLPRLGHNADHFLL